MGADTLLAFDYGRRRIGVAIGNAVTRQASPLQTIDCPAGGPDWRALGALLETWKPIRLVVGLPYNADGSESPMGAEARRFARQLAGRSRLPVDMVDERLSSAEAGERLRESRREGQLGRRVRRADVDRMAAAVILQGWFDRHG